MEKKYTTHDNIVRVIECHKLGMSSTEIEQQTGVKCRTVQNLVAKFKASGSTTLPTHGHRGGTKAKVSPKSLLVLKRDLDLTPCLSARKIKENNPLLFGECSVRTVQRRVHQDLGYRKIKAKRKPLLTKKHIKDRLEFIRNHSEWGEEEWRSVLWSDEATFYVSDGSGKYVWRKPGSDPYQEKMIAKTVKFPAYIMVWGCFGYGGVGELVVLPRNTTVRKESYINLLNENLEASLLKTNTSVFQQDGAPAHTAKMVTKWLNQNRVNFIKKWPGNSPDLSPIENIWGIMKRRLQDKDTSNLEKLTAEVRSAWESISDDICHRLADSLPSRLKECKKKKGVLPNFSPHICEYPE